MLLLDPLQVYERFDTKTIEDADESRFEYFTKQVSLSFGLLGYLCRQWSNT